MQTVFLGSESLGVSELVLGCMALTSFYSAKLRDEAINVIEQAAEKGAILLDKANNYVYPDFFLLLTLRSPIICQKKSSHMQSPKSDAKTF